MAIRNLRCFSGAPSSSSLFLKTGETSVTYPTGIEFDMSVSPVSSQGSSIGIYSITGYCPYHGLVRYITILRAMLAVEIISFSKHTPYCLNILRLPLENHC